MTGLNGRAHRLIPVITLLLTLLCAVAVAQNKSSGPPPEQQLAEPSKTHDARQASKPVDPSSRRRKAI